MHFDHDDDFELTQGAESSQMEADATEALWGSILEDEGRALTGGTVAATPSELTVDAESLYRGALQAAPSGKTVVDRDYKLSLLERLQNQQDNWLSEAQMQKLEQLRAREGSRSDSSVPIPGATNPRQSESSKPERSEIPTPGATTPQTGDSTGGERSKIPTPGATTPQTGDSTGAERSKIPTPGATTPQTGDSTGAERSRIPTPGATDPQFSESGKPRKGEGINKPEVGESKNPANDQVYEGKKPQKDPAYEGKKPQKDPAYEGKKPQKDPIYEGKKPQKDPAYEGTKPQKDPIYEGKKPQKDPIYEGKKPQKDPIYEGKKPQKDPIDEPKKPAVDKLPGFEPFQDLVPKPLRMQKEEDKQLQERNSYDKEPLLNPDKILPQFDTWQDNDRTEDLQPARDPLEGTQLASADERYHHVSFHPVEGYSSEDTEGRDNTAIAEDAPSPTTKSEPLAAQQGPDGSMTARAEDGSRLIHRADGTAIIESPNGRSKVSPNGLFTLTMNGVEERFSFDSAKQRQLADGSTEYSFSDGTTVVSKNAQGNFGGLIIQHPNGTGMETFANNRSVIQRIRPMPR